MPHSIAWKRQLDQPSQLNGMIRRPNDVSLISSLKSEWCVVGLNPKN
jgi:hypothetical protein